MAALSMGTMFPKELESEIFSLVKGHSSLALMSGQEGLPFVGKDIFTFNFDSDISIVGENGAKPVGDATIDPVSIVPIKVVYQMRTSDEFKTASEEYRMNVLGTFAEGFAKKLGAGLDKMAIHGINPATGQSAPSIAAKAFDTVVTNKVSYVAAQADANLDDAVALVEANEYDANGAIIAPAMRSALAALSTTDGGRKYPDFAFGGIPGALGTMKLDKNATVSAGGSDDKAIVGDFENAFRWGIAKEMPLETIEYGDPDGQGDLKKFNQILLRSEAYIGWAIMDKDAFAIVGA